ncbi:MAG: polymer-forming cytoskeletal protein [Rhodocyclaceae bacterium]|nr:polymer-forming cytoskeletal protein [Rhodocyclaceae bacterium]
MFGKKNRKNTIEVSKLSSLIADNVVVVGDVLFSGGLRVDGRIEGNVLGKPGEQSLVVLSRKGCVVGRVHAFDAVINGAISGDLEVEHFLELQAGAKVSGNIIYRQLQMECGATIEGKLVRREEFSHDEGYSGYGSSDSASDHDSSSSSSPSSSSSSSRSSSSSSRSSSGGSSSSSLASSVSTPDVFRPARASHRGK